MVRGRDRERLGPVDDDRGVLPWSRLLIIVSILLLCALCWLDWIFYGWSLPSWL
jgi:hypothetical protein